VNDLENEKSRIINVDIEQEMKKSFISYAMAVIINRALPDVRDGLKPVHRRILYAMSELGLSPEKPFRKCARIVGDVLGKYHPHGDKAVYDTMVRLAQDFSIRHMLVQGHGNFGSVDGDSPAAMRYTEAKLSKISMELLRDIEKNTVDYYPNFDETLMQPTVLPAKYPNLLVNGSGGIAVGMATNIPPHNLAEVIDGTMAMLDDPEISIEQLMEFITGPDFPTGGIAMGVSGIRRAYFTGRGKVSVRAKAEIDQYKENKSRIIVTELPYQVNKANLIEKIANLVSEKKIEGISDLRDESDKDGMRMVIELKRDVNANIVLNRLYKHTQMQDTFGIIMLSLVGGEPKVLNLKEMLYHYIVHQKDVIERRTRYELEKAKARAHILEGLLIALDNIDEVVKIIRSSKDVATAKATLIARFGLSDKQAQAILDMRLSRLTGLEREKIENEYKELLKKIDYLLSILNTPQMVVNIIKEELSEVKHKYQDDRRTEITFAENEIDLDELIQEEDMTVTLTHYGYIKRISADTYRSQRRGGRGVAGLSTRENDFAENVFVTSTHSELLFFSTKGNVYRKKCYEIPESSRTAKGMAIVNLLALDANEKITSVFPIVDYAEESYLTMVTKKGFVKKTSITEYIKIRQSGLRAIGLRDDDELIRVFQTNKGDDIIVGSKNGISIRFDEAYVRAMGRTAMGVKAISLKANDELVDAAIIAPESDIFVITENGFGKRTKQGEYRSQVRGGVGVKTINITQKTGQMVGLKVVDGDEDIMIINDAGIIIRMNTAEISVFGRSAQGVRVMKVNDQAKVVCVAKVPMGEEEELELNEAGEVIEAIDAGEQATEMVVETGEQASEEASEEAGEETQE
jgi:DNA gyrase subunit A